MLHRKLLSGAWAERRPSFKIHPHRHGVISKMDASPMRIDRRTCSAGHHNVLGFEIFFGRHDDSAVAVAGGCEEE